MPARAYFLAEEGTTVRTVDTVGLIVLLGLGLKTEAVGSMMAGWWQDSGRIVAG